MLNLVMTHKEAKAAGLHTFINGISCKRGHTSERYASTGACIACHAFYEKKPYVKPTGEALEKRREEEAKRHRDATVVRQLKRDEKTLALMKSMSLDLPIKRYIAQKLGHLHYFTGKPCIKGHIAKRFTTGGCSECALEFSSQSKKRMFAEDPDAVRAKDRQNYHKDPNKKKNSNKRYVKANRHKVRAWQRAHPTPPEKQNVINARRRASKLSATPPWTTPEMKEEIKAIYRQSAAMTRDLGVIFNVDHAVPLKGVVVCGLHVPWNLRIITEEENLSRPKQFNEPHLARYAPLPLGHGAALEHYQL